MKTSDIKKAARGLAEAGIPQEVATRGLQAYAAASPSDRLAFLRRRSYVGHRQRREEERLAEVRRLQARHQLQRVELALREPLVHAQLLLSKGEEVPDSLRATIETLGAMKEELEAKLAPEGEAA